ncbi:MAG: DUF2165 family protein, partial [Actinomycetes bacterium]
MIDDTTLIFRIAPLLLVAGTTLMATIVVVGNLTDPRSNLQYVERILSMDTTFRSPRLMWRAIRSPKLQRLAFGVIVLLEAAVVVTGWIGTVILASNLSAGTDDRLDVDLLVHGGGDGLDHLRGVVVEHEPVDGLVALAVAVPIPEQEDQNALQMFDHWSWIESQLAVELLHRTGDA